MALKKIIYQPDELYPLK